MTRNTKILLATTGAGVVAVGLVLTGVWWIWPPAALIVAGLVLMRLAGTFHEKREK